LPQKPDQIASSPAARIEDAHSGRNATAQNLVEQIDVDLAKLFAEICHD
jgi:hypothetical protein